MCNMGAMPAVSMPSINSSMTGALGGGAQPLLATPNAPALALGGGTDLISQLIAAVQQLQAAIGGSFAAPVPTATDLTGGGAIDQTGAAADGATAKAPGAGTDTEASKTTGTKAGGGDEDTRKSKKSKKSKKSSGHAQGGGGHASDGGGRARGGGDGERTSGGGTGRAGGGVDEASKDKNKGKGKGNDKRGGAAPKRSTSAQRSLDHSSKAQRSTTNDDLDKAEQARRDVYTRTFSGSSEARAKRKKADAEYEKVVQKRNRAMNTPGL